MQYGHAADEEVLKEFAGKILPPNHPLVRQVTNVASRIITGTQKTLSLGNAVFWTKLSLEHYPRDLKNDSGQSG